MNENSFLCTVTPPLKYCQKKCYTLTHGGERRIICRVFSGRSVLMVTTHSILHTCCYVAWKTSSKASFTWWVPLDRDAFFDCESGGASWMERKKNLLGKQICTYTRWLPAIRYGWHFDVMFCTIFHQELEMIKMLLDTPDVIISRNKAGYRVRVVRYIRNSDPSFCKVTKSSCVRRWEVGCWRVSLSLEWKKEPVVSWWNIAGNVTSKCQPLSTGKITYTFLPCDKRHRMRVHWISLLPSIASIMIRVYSSMTHSLGALHAVSGRRSHGPCCKVQPITIITYLGLADVSWSSDRTPDLELFNTMFTRCARTAKITHEVSCNFLISYPL